MQCSVFAHINLRDLARNDVGLDGDGFPKTFLVSKLVSPNKISR